MSQSGPISTSKSYTCHRDADDGSGEQRDELWLSTNPGIDASSLNAIATDATFGYPVVIHNDKSSGCAATQTRPGTTARELVTRKKLSLVVSGMEDGCNETVVESGDRLLKRMSTIWDAYLKQNPEEALLVDTMLVMPGTVLLHNHTMTEDFFNGLFQSHTIVLLNLIIALAQKMCAWWHSQHPGAVHKPLLPLDEAQQKVQVVTSREASVLGFDAPALKMAAQFANPDFFVLCGSQILTTIESKPSLNAFDAGVLLRNRQYPCGQAEGSSTPETSSWVGDLTLQLYAQALATKTPRGLIAADFGRLMIPFEFVFGESGESSTRKEKTVKGNIKERPQDQTELRMSFSSTLSYCNLKGGPGALEEARSQAVAGLEDPDRKLTLNELPNTVMFLFAWILSVYEKDGEFDAVQQAMRQSEEPEDDAGGAANKEPKRDNEGGDEGPSSKRRRGAHNPTGHGNATGSSASPDASTRRGPPRAVTGMYKDRSKSARPTVDNLPVLTTYQSTYGPMDDGTFATLHWCLIRKSHLDDARTTRFHLDDEPRGRWTTRDPSVLRADEIQACLKVQRRSLTYEEQSRDAAYPRFESADDSPLDAEERDGIETRTLQELAVFLHCKDLQGVCIPVLYGVISKDNYPRSTAMKLMMQLIRASGLGPLNKKLLSFWRLELVTGIRAAFEALHTRGVCHGDVNTGNVLVEWRQQSSRGVKSTDSGQPDVLHPYRVLNLLLKAQQEEATSSDPSGSSFNDVNDPVDHPDVVSKGADNSSPLQRLKRQIRPHIWIIDFAESKIFPAGEGREALLKEAEAVQKNLIDRIEAC